jgi:hypothetical protein
MGKNTNLLILPQIITDESIEETGRKDISHSICFRF